MTAAKPVRLFVLLRILFRLNSLVIRICGSSLTFDSGSPRMGTRTVQRLGLVHAE